MTAKRYDFRKLGRRPSAGDLHPMVATGQSVFGKAYRLTDKAAQDMTEGKDFSEHDESIWEEQTELKPRIGQVMKIQGRGLYEWIRTSCVKSYYVHEAENEHPDKLVLPQGFPIEEMGRLPEMKKGDALVATMNSIYFARMEE